MIMEFVSGLIEGTAGLTGTEPLLPNAPDILLPTSISG
jgi:hypothetical protein